MIRTILHIDMDAFFAAVEQRDHPELRGRPVVVGAAGDARGVVAAASYEARAFGIHSAMSSREAARRCPDAVFVPTRHDHYTSVSREIFEIFARYTPEIEPLSIDEAFLDVTGAKSLFGDGRMIAEKIRADIRQEVGLTASAGIAMNKYLAKIASDMNKPDGITEVPTSPHEIKRFLAPLPVGRIWGVGPVLESKLRAENITTIGDLQGINHNTLERIAGKHTADHLRKLCIGEDHRPVEAVDAEKSISREHTFGRDVRDPVVLQKMLGELIADVGQKLRSAQLYAGSIRIKIRWQGFKTITRQCRLDAPICDDMSLRESGFRLFRAEPLLRPVRLIGFGVQDLQSKPNQQLSLFDDKGSLPSNRERLSRTVDGLRNRFGDQSVGFGGS